MLKQDYIDAQKIMNQAKNELEGIFNKTVPESTDEMTSFLLMERVHNC